jgi:hypothetical protein
MNVINYTQINIFYHILEKYEIYVKKNLLIVVINRKFRNFNISEVIPQLRYTVANLKQEYIYYFACRWQRNRYQKNDINKIVKKY